MANKPAPATLVAKDVSAIRSLAAPVAPRAPPGPMATVVISLLSAFGLLPPVAPVPVDVTGVPAQPVPGTSANAGVTGVKVGSSNLTDSGRQRRATPARPTGTSRPRPTAPCRRRA